MKKLEPEKFDNLLQVAQPQFKHSSDLLSHTTEIIVTPITLSSFTFTEKGYVIVFTYKSLLVKCRVLRIKISVSKPPGVNYSTRQPINYSYVF
jgi:hypothetical protein